jgi:hypothetical protein
MFAYISWDAFVLVLLLTLVALWDAVATYSHGVDLIPDRERLPGRIYRRVAVPLVFAGAAAFAHYLW